MVLTYRKMQEILKSEDFYQLINEKLRVWDAPVEQPEALSYVRNKVEIYIQDAEIERAVLSVELEKLHLLRDKLSRYEGAQ